jgi:8-oxo-dGTP diphosphatase
MFKKERVENGLPEGTGFRPYLQTMNTTKRMINGALCYIIHREQVLLLKRARPPHIGLWSPPGGKMEHGESPQECCTREIYEETGLIVHDPMLRGIQTVINTAYNIHWLLFIFCAYDYKGSLLPPETEEGELRWIPLAELEQYQRPYADTRYWPYITTHNSGIWQAKYIYSEPGKLVSEELYLDMA